LNLNFFKRTCTNAVKRTVSLTHPLCPCQVYVRLQRRVLWYQQCIYQGQQYHRSSGWRHWRVSARWNHCHGRSSLQKEADRETVSVVVFPRRL